MPLRRLPTLDELQLLWNIQRVLKRLRPGEMVYDLHPDPDMEQLYREVLVFRRLKSEAPVPDP